MNFHKKKFLYILFFIPLLIFMSYVYFNEDIKVIYPSEYINNSNSEHLVVHYIDVGQGDCQLIQIGNVNMLIDSGPKAYEEKVLDYLKSQGVKTLDYVIATHPHEDHIGGMDAIIKSFKINTFIAPKVSSTTEEFEDMIRALRKKKLKITTARAGVAFNLTPNTLCQIIAPISSYYEETNNYSTILKLKYINTSFLFTGDAEELIEKEVLYNSSNVSSDVLKVGHHGSNTSTSREFLKFVNPIISVISCGRNNMYKHPHIETITKLKDVGSEIYRTDINHNIVIVSDGNVFKVIHNQ